MKAMEIWKSRGHAAGLGTWRYGGIEVCKRGNMEVWEYGALEACCRRAGMDA